MFLFKYPGRKGVRRVFGTYRDAALAQDGTLVKLLSHDVNGAATFGSTGSQDRFMYMAPEISLSTEIGQQRRVNVDDASLPLFDDRGRDFYQVPGKNDQIGIPSVQLFEQCAFECGSIGKMYRVQHRDGNVVLLCPMNGSDACSLCNEAGNSCRNSFLLNSIQYGLEVAARAGGKYNDRLQGGWFLSGVDCTASMWGRD